MPVITNTKGPYYDKAGNHWRLSWKEDGTAKFKSAKDRAVLDALLDTLAPPAAISLKAIKSFAGSAKQIKRAYCDALIALNCAIREGNHAKLDMVEKYIKCLKLVADGIVPHSKYAELEEDHKELIAYVKDIKSRRNSAKNQTINRIITTSVKGRKKPRTKVSRSSNST